MRYFVLIALLLVSPGLQAQVVSVSWFAGDASDSIETQPNAVYGNCLVDRILGGQADLCDPLGGTGVHKIHQWSWNCTAVQHTGFWWAALPASAAEFRFDAPVEKFGAYFGTLEGFGAGPFTIDFYDAAGALIGTQTGVNISTNCGWMWKGWQSLGAPIKRAVLISSASSGSFVFQVDDIQATWPPCIDGDGDGFSSCGGDCNDSDPAIHPGVAELCDGVDQNCDGQVDEGLSTDIDGDGHFAIGGCLAPADDCNDLLASVHPGALEIPYDGVDQDCDGVDPNDLDGDGFNGGLAGSDCADLVASINPSAVEGPLCDGADTDCNGLVDDGLPCTDDDGDGFSEIQGDCDDTDPSRSPGRYEVGNGVDDDCNGLIDDGLASVDDDGDGFCDAMICSDGSLPGDCADENVLVSPGQSDSTCDGVDNDCNGSVDDGGTCGDADGDGFTAAGGDCNDLLGSVHPGAPELPNYRDDNCDGFVDEDTALSDDDGDGYCEGFDTDNDGIDECNGTAVPGDCLDIDASVHPGATDVWDNGIDEDCDGVFAGTSVDSDGDGWGDSLDCNPTEASVHPGAVELCNGVDDDCDGGVDELTAATDTDGDGFCRGCDSNGDGSEDCSDGATPGDCYEGDPDVHPGSVEGVNGMDDDCDGLVDEGSDGYDDDGDGYTEETGDCDDADPNINPGANDLVDDGVDQDCDGVDAEAVSLPSEWDQDGDGYRPVDGDCDDLNATIHPFGSEICDNLIDDDCDGRADPEELCPSKVAGGCGADLSPQRSRSWLLLLLLGLGLRRRRAL